MSKDTDFRSASTDDAIVHHGCTGAITTDIYHQILSTLCLAFPQASKGRHNPQNVTRNLQFLRTMMVRCSRPGILRNRHTDEKVVVSSIRNCHQKTFQADLVEKSQTILHHSLMNALRKPNTSSNYEVKNMQFESTHLDIILYKKGGFFKPHRDHLLTPPSEMKDAKMFTFILCLDSRVNDTKEGNTVVWFPNQTGLTGDGILAHKFLRRHSFPHSRKPRHYVIFPSQSLHAGAPIFGRKSFKLCLKLDIWIEFVHKPSVSPMRHLTEVCSCLECNKGKNAVVSKIMEDTTLSQAVASIVVSFLDTSRKACICTSYERTFRRGRCRCTCMNCCGNRMCKAMMDYYDEIEEERLREEDEERDFHDWYCNGDYSD